MWHIDFPDRDIPPRAQVIEKCILHLLNSKEWMAVLNVDYKAPYVQVSELKKRWYWFQKKSLNHKFPDSSYKTQLES